MAYSYDLLPPIVPDSIPPSSNGIFIIPITMYGEAEKQKTLSGFGINTVQIAITNQNNSNQKIINKTGKEVKRDSNDNSLFLLELTSRDFNFSTDQYYKIQIRFSRQLTLNTALNSNNFSEWSSVCLIKKIKAINLKISMGDFLLTKEYKKENEKVFPNVFSYIKGEMESSSNEILKNYQIIMQKKNSNNVYSEYFKTDFLAPDRNNQFLYKLNKGFLAGEHYRLIVNANTVSGYSFPTQCYYFTIAGGIGDEEPFFCQAEENEEQGSIDICIVGKNTLRKNFIIQRASSQDNFTSWEKMAVVQFKGEQQKPVQIYNNKNSLTSNSDYQNYTKLVWSDRTIKSGIFYQYAVAILYKSIDYDGAFLAGTYKETKIKTCILEDMYLMGENKSLRIKYNPEINNFKYNINQSVQTTIGSKYPFVMRSGKNNYRSFQIGGLITAFMDMDSRSFVPPNAAYQLNVQQKNDRYYINENNYNKLKTLFSDFIIGPKEDIKTIGETITDIINFPENPQIKILQQDGTVVNYSANSGDIVLYKNANNYYFNFIFQDDSWKKIINNSYELKSFISSEELFSKATLDYRRTYNTQHNINQYNDIIYEREFREAVYKFLYDPSPKLFRSSQEGNILIKLTNISFSPVKQLGRQLYSFTADAIEIDECNMDNLYKYKIYSSNSWESLFGISSYTEMKKNIQINNSKDFSLKNQLTKSNFLHFSSINLKVREPNNLEMKITVITKDGQSLTYVVNQNGLNLKNIEFTQFIIHKTARKVKIDLTYSYSCRKSSIEKISYGDNQVTKITNQEINIKKETDISIPSTLISISLSTKGIKDELQSLFDDDQNNVHNNVRFACCFLINEKNQKDYFITYDTQIRILNDNNYIKSIKFKGLCCTQREWLYGTKPEPITINSQTYYFLPNNYGQNNLDLTTIKNVIVSYETIVKKQNKLYFI